LGTDASLDPDPCEHLMDPEHSMELSYRRDKKANENVFKNIAKYDLVL
jgi:hypothetical protein